MRFAGAGAVPLKSTLEGVIYSNRVTNLLDLKHDDELAAAEAKAQGNRPGMLSRLMEWV